MRKNLHKILQANIRRLARERGVTLLELTGQAGVSRAQLYDVFSGKVSPTLEWLDRIARVLEVELVELLTDARG